VSVVVVDLLIGEALDEFANQFYRTNAVQTVRTRQLAREGTVD